MVHARNPQRARALDPLIGRGADLAVADFIDRWESADPPAPQALAHLVLLIDDWGRLLRTDPGLPSSLLEPGWPSARSTRTFRCLLNRLSPRAEEQIGNLLRPEK
ncbi:MULTISPECIES: PaaX family transcriptional regulator C-terminal domain-containing protein [Streptomyces]|uniref:PaaX family transcriptional regulator C-terminal domain-containing protein n=1 Tax=Streptomyces TaxID=1883 RepID=UPI001EFACFC9|nr:PaaX family transcriptional regulator C-terminal domain-containing protein [Streptomyces sp. CL12-4]MCG8969007.1 hypothetical protein [Streptomyces sp. CL12-4]